MTLPLVRLHAAALTAGSAESARNQRAWDEHFALTPLSADSIRSPAFLALLRHGLPPAVRRAAWTLFIRRCDEWFVA